MGFVDDIKQKAEELGEKAGEAFEAAKDKAEWLNNLARNLPNGTGKVEKTGNLITIQVRWDDNRGRIAKSDATPDSETIFTYRTEI